MRQMKQMRKNNEETIRPKEVNVPAAKVCIESHQNEQETVDAESALVDETKTMKMKYLLQRFWINEMQVKLIGLLHKL